MTTPALPALDETHDPTRTSWVVSANDPQSDFPIQNLPFGVFRRRDSGVSEGASEEAGAGARTARGGAHPSWPRVGVAIGDEILDVAAALELGLLHGVGAEACDAPDLNALLALDAGVWTDLRRQISALLAAGSEPARRGESERHRILVKQADVQMLLPMEIGDYTDFYASIHHATNVGSLFRPDNPLLPNYRWIPIGYHGRASSVVVSGTAVRRPMGQRMAPGATVPGWGPSRLMDYELEVGAVIGRGNPLGSPIPLADAEQHLFGLCLLNDWSARDIQAWEYQPLGPFLGKSFASTISPWIITRDALAPYRRPLPPRGPDAPEPLPYLVHGEDQRGGGFDVVLEVHLRTEGMREAGVPPARLSQGNLLDLYWSFAQMITHHTSNGCNLRPGDLLGSGTVSGPEPEARGCLLERTWRGRDPLALPNGEVRTFLEDGDEVILTGHCTAPGRPRIGFGRCSGVLLSAGVQPTL
jgi:fumarylacetoacetase